MQEVVSTDLCIVVVAKPHTEEDSPEVHASLAVAYTTSKTLAHLKKVRMCAKLKSIKVLCANVKCAVR